MNELYKLILVDDEDDVRGRILSKIKDESGFEVVGKAGNGFDALELIEEHRPHVVITDIKMPFINGIELARRIRRDYPTTKVAFISGYDEFEYAREAIELNVVSYLMKPITSRDIDDFLKRLKISLDEEFDILSNTRNIERKYQESIPVLVNSYLNSFRQKAELETDDINRLETYGLDLSEGNYVVGNVSMSRERFDEETKILVQELAQKVFKTFEICITFLTPEGVTFVLEDDRLSSSHNIDLQVFEILKYVEEYRNTTLQFGISKVFHNFKQFPNAFSEGEQSLRHCKYFNMGDIIYFDDIEDIEKKHIVIDDVDFSDFEYELKFGNKQGIKTKLEQILKKTRSDGNVILDHELVIIKISNSLINFMKSINVNIGTVIDGNLIEKLMSYSDSDELKEYVYDLAINLREQNVKSQANKTDRLVEQAIKYVDENYQDPSLSLEEVSEVLNISVSYLSMLLSKLKGITFNKYLIKVRMEKAQELLKLTNEKIVNIATMCGYNEVYYFSHSFKKYTGKSPKEFRVNG